MIRPVQRELYAVIGHPVAHSLSPAMMNRAFAAGRHPGCYLAFEVSEPASDLELLHRLGLRGISVTLPHKRAVMKCCESIDETARAIGAVNTLRRTPRSWEGRNTDWLGVSEAFRPVSSFTGKRALVIGAGGAARAAVFAFLREGTRVAVANRGAERGLRLAREFGCEFVPLIEVSRQRFDLVVHCTPVGMIGAAAHSLDLPDAFFRPEMVVMDAVYRPLWTPFLIQARATGCRILTGLEMLLHQGLAQYQWWTGNAAPAAAMRAALEQAMERETDDSHH